MEAQGKPSYAMLEEVRQWLISSERYEDVIRFDKNPESHSEYLNEMHRRRATLHFETVSRMLSEATGCKVLFGGFIRIEPKLTFWGKVKKLRKILGR